MPKMARTRRTRTAKTRTRKAATAATPMLSPELETRALGIAQELAAADLGVDFLTSEDPSIHSQAGDYIRDSLLMAGEYSRFLDAHPTLADDTGQYTVVAHVLTHALSGDAPMPPLDLLRLTLNAIGRQELLPMLAQALAYEGDDE